jgi:hypothetical protein
MAETQQPDQPNYECADYEAQEPAWQLIQDLLAGTARMQAMAARRQYLPMGEGEPPKTYALRVRYSELYNGLDTTHKGLTGLVFRDPPKLADDVDPAIQRDWEDIDLEGTHGDVFARDLFEDGLALGHAGVLVDVAPNNGELSKAEETARGIRPYWVKYAADQIINWRTQRIGGALEFTLIVLREANVQPQGAFGERITPRYRVLRLVPQPGPAGADPVYVPTWEIWDPKDPANPSQGYHQTGAGVFTGVTRIPFKIFYAGRKHGVLVTKPPLGDLATTNLALFRVRSDHRWKQHLVDVPLLVTLGLEVKDGIVIGPGQALQGPLGADVKWVQPTESTGSRTDQQDLIAEMAAQGLAILARETMPRATETAAAHRIDTTQQYSRLEVAARGLQDCLEALLGLHAEYRGVAGGSVQITMDFEQLTMDPQMLQVISQAQTAGQLSLETLWSLMIAGKILPEDFDPELEKQRIQDETPPPPPALAPFAGTGPGINVPAGGSGLAPLPGSGQ